MGRPGEYDLYHEKGRPAFQSLPRPEGGWRVVLDEALPGGKVRVEGNVVFASVAIYDAFMRRKHPKEGR